MGKNARNKPAAPAKAPTVSRQRPIALKDAEKSHLKMGNGTVTPTAVLYVPVTYSPYCPVFVHLNVSVPQYYPTHSYANNASYPYPYRPETPTSTIGLVHVKQAYPDMTSTLSTFIIPDGTTTPTFAPKTSTTTIFDAAPTSRLDSPTATIMQAWELPSLHPDTLDTANPLDYDYPPVAAQSYDTTTTTPPVQDSSGQQQQQQQRCVAKCSYAHLDRQAENPHLQNVVAMDCEFVEIQSTYGDTRQYALGRVSLVDHKMNVLLDEHAQLQEGQVLVDAWTGISGIKPEHLQTGLPFPEVQRRVRDLIQGKVLVIHDPRQDFKVLGLDHPAEDVRDTSACLMLVEAVKGKGCRMRVGLKHLAKHFLDLEIQTGTHCSVVDAQATMSVYRKVWQYWKQGPEHHLQDNMLLWGDRERCSPPGLRELAPCYFYDGYFWHPLELRM